jgi:hypothetical protein
MLHLPPTSSSIVPLNNWHVKKPSVGGEKFVSYEKYYQCHGAYHDFTTVGLSPRTRSAFRRGRP